MSSGPAVSLIKEHEIHGAKLVTIPLSDYLDLMAAKRVLAERTVSHSQLLSPQRSVIERNPEVAVFLAQNFGLSPLPAVLKKCRRQFGRARTPSKSAAYRYWKVLREKASSGL